MKIKMKGMKNLFKSGVILAVAFFTTQIAFAQQKIGHVNYSEIVAATTDYKTAQEELSKFAEDKRKILLGLDEAFQKKQKEANDKYNTRSVANQAAVDAELAVIYEDLKKMDNNMQESQRQAEEDMQKKQAELFQPIQKKVMDAITSVSTEKGYAYVLDVSTGSIPFFQGGDDLTAAVKTKLGIK